MFRRGPIWLLLLAVIVATAFACGDPSTGSGQADDDDDAVATDDDDDNDDDDDDNDDNDDDTAGVETEWYRQVVFMEIFPRSYADSNDDGIGDLPGLTAKLPYIADLGVGALWLTPIYPTPFVDSGYDVADYTGINPDYGTLDDFDALIDEAHALGLRVFMDGVFNHTSDQHPWFVQSRSSRDDPKRDWYLWGDQPLFRCAGLSVGGAEERAWAYDEATGQYYWHHFREGMPDLNPANPEVRDALADVLRFWLDRGVDGFRLDVAHLYFEDDTTCEHHPRTHDLHKMFRSVLDEYEDRALVGELIGDAEDMAAYFGNGRDELHMVLNFSLTYAIHVANFLHAPAIMDALLTASLEAFPAGAQNTVFMSNHDFYRSYDLFFRNDDRTKLMAVLQMTLPGTPFVYYGEEIGMAGGREIVTDYRDAARTPMHWDDSAFAGFSTVAPWIDLAPNFLTHNVVVEDAEPNSLLNHYRRIIAVRNANPALQTGVFEPLATGGAMTYAFFRADAEQEVLVVLNFGGGPQTAHLNLAATRWRDATDTLRDLYSGVEFPAPAGDALPYRVTLPGYGFALLVRD